MTTFWFAYLMAYTLDGNQFSAAGNTPTKAGVETRVEIPLGPHGPDKVLCEKYADAVRKTYAQDKKLADYRLLKYDCRMLPLAAKP